MQNANPNFKTGIKTLTEIQIKNSLPGYDTLLKKFETVRENAAALDNKLKIDGSFDSLKYDNIFSILGGRGAGKTSVLNTLYQKLGENENNILMPVIMPELVDDNDNFIGWILSAIETNLTELENKIRNSGCRNDDDDYNFFTRCAFNNNNKLRETFNQLKQAYYARVYNHRNGNWDYSTDFSLVSRVNDEGFSLIKRFAEFWNQLVDVYVQYTHKEKSTPLFFFFIDDADLKPSIINELIFCIPKYFSHPNVVVLISAAPKTLGYVVKNHMYQQITGSSFPLVDLMEIEKEYNGDIYQHSLREEEQQANRVKFQELRYGKEYVKITKLTEEILRKLFPVSNRFYLKKYEKFEEKMSLIIEDKEDNRKIEHLIIENFKDFKKAALELHTKSKISKRIINEKLKISLYNDKIDNLELNNMIFFGKYPRDIVGVYYSFIDLLKDLINALNSFYTNSLSYKVGNAIPSDFLDVIHSSCVSFLKAVILSNDNLFMFMKKADHLILKRKLHWQLYVDYAAVIEALKTPEFIDENKNNSAPFVQMLSLLNFIECLIVLIMPDRKTIHGHNEFCNLLDVCDIPIIKKSDSFSEMLTQYNKFDCVNMIDKYDINNFTHQDYFLDVVYCMELYPSNKQAYSAADILKNKKWYETFSETMYLRFSISNLVKEHKSELLLLKKPEFCDNQYRELYRNYMFAFSNWLFERCIYNSEIKKKSNADLTIIIDSFQKSIFKLIYELDNTILFCFGNKVNDALESFNKELGYCEGNNRLKKEFLVLMQWLKKEDYQVKRGKLMSKLTSIKQLINNANTYINELSSWYYRLYEMFEGNLTIANYKDPYQIDCISEDINDYFEALNELYFKEITPPITIEGVKKLKQMFYDEIDTTYISNYINDLRWQDYDELTNSEDDI